MQSHKEHISTVVVLDSLKWLLMFHVCWFFMLLWIYNS